MDIRAAEISDIIRKQIQDYEKSVEVTETGTVLTAGDGIARVYGLSGAMAGELLEFIGTGGQIVQGMVLNLEEDNVGVALLGKFESISEGDTARRTGRIVEVPVGDELLGRVVNAIGQPIDGGAPLTGKKRRKVEIKAPGHHGPQVGARADADRHQGHRLDDPDRSRPARADHRRPRHRQDRGRDRHDHQPEGSERVLLLRGHRPEAVDGGLRRRQAHRRPARWSTRPSSSPAPPSPRRCSSSRRTPACTMAEYFRDSGQHALIVYDDLSKQAVAYRQLSLLLRRPPGREAYPGDVFYLHSRLLERAAKLVRQGGRRLAHRAADHRDPGRRRLGVHPDQRHLDHRRPDLPRGRSVLLRHPAGRERRHLGVARRWRRPDQGHEQGRRSPPPRARAATARWPRSRSSAPTSTRPRRRSSPAASA